MLAKPNPLKEKSLAFAIRIVRTYKYFITERKEFIIVKQLLRSGTAIGALYREAEYAETKADFIHKMAIAQKECNETLFWLELLFFAEYLDEKQFRSLYSDVDELMKIISTMLKTAKRNLNEEKSRVSQKRNRDKK